MLPTTPRVGRFSRRKRCRQALILHQLHPFLFPTNGTSGRFRSASKIGSLFLLNNYSSDYHYSYFVIAFESLVERSPGTGKSGLAIPALPDTRAGAVEPDFPVPGGGAVLSLLSLTVLTASLLPSIFF